jgi:uncharacterized RDD family membrane protein YckC
MAARGPTDHPNTPRPTAPPALLCPRCGRSNPPDEPRCLRCQARLGVAPDAHLRQPRLDLKLDWPKVIPFEWIAPERVPQPPPKARSKAAAPARPRAARKPSPDQLALDLELPARLPVATRPAHRSEAPPAPYALRVAAFGLDAILVLLGAVCFLTGMHLGGAPILLERAALCYYGLALFWLAVFYKAFFCLLGCDSPGVRLLGLRLVRFDRRPLSWRERVLRLCAAVVTTAGLGAGLWWALLDRERLTWYDLISQACLAEADRLPASERAPAFSRR